MTTRRAAPDGRSVPFPDPLSGNRWQTALPVAAIVIALTALLVAPFWMGREVRALRDDIANAADPARTIVTEIQYLLARQTSALRGYWITGDDSYLALYRKLAADERLAYARLAPLVDRLEPEILRQFVQLEAISREWHTRVNEDELPPLRRAGGARRVPQVPFEHSLYLEALDVARQLDDSIARAARVRRMSIERAEREWLLLSLVLVVLAVSAAAALTVLARRVGRLAEAAQTGRAEAERALAEMTRAVEARARLLRGITHDVKNPLAAADGFASLLEAGLKGPLDPGQAECIAKIRRSIRSALDIVSDLLDLGGAESGRLTIQRVVTDLALVVQQSVEDHRGLLEGVGHSMVVELPTAPLVVHSDPGRIRQVLANLLSNAIKYTPVPGRIMVLAEQCPAGPGERPGTWAAVRVGDSGPGLPPGAEEAIFDEFARFATGRAEGHGLGLPISRRVARLLGGEITARDTGSGAEFTLWLPLHREAAPPPAHSRAIGSGPSAGGAPP